MHILDSLLSAIAPHYCVQCGAAGSMFCDSCIASVEVRIPSRCFMCHSLTDESATCKKCRAKHQLPKNVWVYDFYDNESKGLVRSLKYGRARGAARAMALLLDSTLPYLDPKTTLFVPIPTAPARVRARGLDHSLLLAKELSGVRGVPYSRLLGRSSNVQQVGATRKKRMDQLKGVFSYEGQAMDKTTRIVLIDDLVTTGGSLIAATSALKAAGHKNVHAAIFAQK